jgi:hypothetical protein
LQAAQPATLFLAGEAGLESCPDSRAALLKLLQQPLGSVGAIVAHPPRYRCQLFRRRRQRPCRLVGFDAEAILKPREKQVVRFEVAGFIH